MKKNCPPGFTEVQLTPGAEIVRVTLEEGLMGEYLTMLTRYGGAFTITQAAKLAGVSQSRMGDLVRKGQISLVEVVFGVTPDADVLIEQLIPGNALRRWMAQPKGKGGRGHRAPAMTLADVAA